MRKGQVKRGTLAALDTQPGGQLFVVTWVSGGECMLRYRTICGKNVQEGKADISCLRSPTKAQLSDPDNAQTIKLRRESYR